MRKCKYSFSIESNNNYARFTFLRYEKNFLILFLRIKRPIKFLDLDYFIKEFEIVMKKRLIAEENLMSVEITQLKKAKTKNILSIKDLFIEYRTLEGTVYAVNGIDLSLQEGDTLALVGETGAGKTTTVLSILKLLPKQGFITKGEMIFNGKNLLKISKKEIESIRGNQISMIFQDPLSSLNPVFSVAYQIAETIKVHQQIGWKEVYQRVDEMMRSVGISPDRVNDFPYEFSGGMIQRVMIAIALACQPRLLIADEPTTALDVTIQAQVIELMKELKRKFKTSLIFITHDLGIVPEVCEFIAVVYAGRIMEIGTIEEIYYNPMHPYTIGLFNCIPDIDFPEKKLIPISGFPLSPKLILTGCPFYSRCKEAYNYCENNIPKIKKVSDFHQIACFKRQ